MNTDRIVALPGSLYEQVSTLWRNQANDWPLLRTGRADLASVRVRACDLDRWPVQLQCNPRRIKSAAAKTDAASIAKRPCFLCERNLPAEQRTVPFGDDWWILCNPAPIFDPHLVIASRHHEPQRITAGLATLLELARAFDGRLTVFYNGPGAGASAPDHLHLQAIPRGALPIESWLDSWLSPGASRENEQLRWLRRDTPSIAMISHPACRAAVFIDDDLQRLHCAVSSAAGELGDTVPADPEPRLNLFATYDAGTWRVWLIARRAHRAQSFGDGPGQFVVSPGAIDLGGVLITPRAEDFEQLTPRDIATILQDVLISPEHQQVWTEYMTQRGADEHRFEEQS